MATFLVDPTKFQAEGALVNWVESVRRLSVPGVNIQGQNFRPTIQLRWMLKGELGLPTEPFQIWSRPHSLRDGTKRLDFSQTSLLFQSMTAITWPDGAMGSVTVQIAAPSGGFIAAFAGSPSISSVVAIQSVTAGATSVSLSASFIDGLLVSSGISVSGVQGVTPDALSQADGWTKVETVGLPVKEADWAAFSRQGTKQGLEGAETDAFSAAIDRLKRGAPPLGWASLLASGTPAPNWRAPDFDALVNEANGELMDRLRDVAANFSPGEQAAQKQTMAIPAPANSAGQSMTTDSSDGQVSPLSMTFLAAGTDPFLSLTLGFGTAYPLVNADDFKRRVDFRITAHWEKGLDGQSAPLDMAALIPLPGAPPAPPPPANLVAQMLGWLKPELSDGPWRASARVAWDRPPAIPLFRTVSFAAARVGLAPAEPVAALMQKRRAGGFAPIVINSPNPDDPESWRLNFIDHELPVAANPGTRSLLYGAAVQDIYGQWTPWKTVNLAMTQPDLDQVRLASAKLTPQVPASGAICPATLEVEFLWDWSVRTPGLIRFAGQLFVAAEHGSPAPPGPPGGLSRSLGGAEPFLEVKFAGDVPSVPGATIIGLTADGEGQALFGPAQGTEARRYRLTVPGFSLNFDATGHIGLSLWAQAQERIAPQRLGAWSANPIVVSTSDPRPPVVPIEHVAFSSLPDAAGEAHARIAWTAQPNSAGYFIYESDETQVLRALGRPEPTPSQTLDDRLKIIKDNFAAIPRRAFTRLNSTALTGTSHDVVLPRGSTAIHLYIIIGSSAGQVESDWPTSPDALIALATPHIMVPAPPMLEVQRVLDEMTVPPSFKARLSVATRPGPRVKKIDLHRVRVDDAAKELDTMGPPLLRLENSGGGWIVAKNSDAFATDFITGATGTDAPDGSWRRVWYRAVAWTGPDATRGGLPGRSPASSAAWIVIPPADPPALSALLLGTGPAPPDIIAQWTSSAPVAKTPLGAHNLSVRATLPGAPAHFDPNDTVNRLLTFDSPLQSLPSAPPATGSGVWIVGTTAGVTTYRALIRRAALDDAIQFSVRLTDPLGRSGEVLATIDGGAVNPAPDLGTPTLTKITLPPPARLLLSFSSSSPRDATLDAQYRVRVTASFAPIPRRPPAVIEMALGEVPRPPLRNSATFGLFRQPGSGVDATYIVAAPPQVARFAIRITAPDGRFVEKIKTVSESRLPPLNPP